MYRVCRGMLPRRQNSVSWTPDDKCVSLRLAAEVNVVVMLTDTPFVSHKYYFGKGNATQRIVYITMEAQKCFTMLLQEHATRKASTLKANVRSSLQL